MGIRYYAYAFDSDQTEAALADPRAFISSDPLADAWGFEPHASVATVTFEQTVPERDLLYLDKAWPLLQAITCPSTGGDLSRPSYSMFEGQVTMRHDGWEPWIRPLAPAVMPPIASDLHLLTAEVAPRIRRLAGAAEGDEEYARQYLNSARLFVDGLVRDGRGMVYMIG